MVSLRADRPDHRHRVHVAALLGVLRAGPGARAMRVVAPIAPVAPSTSAALRPPAAGQLGKLLRSLRPTVRYSVLIGIGFLMLYPLLWMITGALKPNHEIFSGIGLIP